MNHPTTQTQFPANQYGQILPAGVNIGFGWTKLATPSQTHLWPSVVAKYTEALAGGRVADPANLVKVDGVTYEVGQGAVVYGEPLKALHRDFASTAIYSAMVLATIKRLATEGAQWSVVVGLALNHFKDDQVRAKVKALWLGPAGDGMHHIDGRNIRIQNVNIVPETFGSVGMLLKDNQRSQTWSQSQAVVLDFGRFTTGWCVLRDCKPTGNTDSVEFGMTNYIRVLTEYLRAQTGVPTLSEEMVESAALGQRELFTKPVNGQRAKLDVAPWMKKAADAVWPQFEAKFKTALGDLRGLDIAVVGGGAYVFGEKIKQAYPESLVYIPDNAQHLNSLGLLDYAQAAVSALAKEGAPA